jgi:hypothetical protein
MAFGVLTAVGQANSKASTSLVITTTGAVSAGRLMVIVVASDNAGTTDAAGADNIAGVTDSRGNVYTLAHGYRNGQGAAQTGAHASIWYSVLTTGLATSDTITITNTTTNYARCAVAQPFSKDATNSVQVAATAQGVGDAAGSSATISGLPSKQYLFVGAGAHENAANMVVTMAGGSAVLFGQQFTSGGSATTNIGGIGGRKIATLTGETLSTASTSDNVLAFVAFEEITSTIQVPATSQSVAVAVGSVTVDTPSAGANVTVDVGGQAVTASAGSVTVAAKANVSAAGQSVTTSVGSVTVSTTARVDVSVPVSGQEAVTSVGAVTATGKAAASVLGQSAAVAAGPVTAIGGAIAPVTGQQVAASVGAVTVDARQAVTVPVTGQAVTAAVGAVSVATAAMAGVGVWNGSAWVEKPVKVWNGSAWVQKPVKHWDGSSWAA